MSVALSLSAALIAIAVVVIGAVTAAGTGGAGADGAEPAAAHRDAADAIERPVPTVAPEPTPVAVEPALTPQVQAQVDYALTYWKDYNPEYGVLGETDCVNFASQTLLARGWQENDEWYNADDVYNASDTWRSSTSMRDWLATRPDLATPLDDTQRDEVQVGDLAQFDWDNSGDRDHTGIVTRVERTSSGTKIYFAGHTLDSDYRDVDTAITVDHPGGTAYYWSLEQ